MAFIANVYCRYIFDFLCSIICCNFFSGFCSNHLKSSLGTERVADDIHLGSKTESFQTSDILLFMFEVVMLNLFVH